jgi:hypothetical protein
MRQAFFNKVSGPIVNKMFECGMIPELTIDRMRTEWSQRCWFEMSGWQRCWG